MKVFPDQMITTSLGVFRGAYTGIAKLFVLTFLSAFLGHVFPFRDIFSIFGHVFPFLGLFCFFLGLFSLFGPLFSFWGISYPFRPLFLFSICGPLWICGPLLPLWASLAFLGLSCLFGPIFPFCGIFPLLGPLFPFRDIFSPLAALFLFVGLYCLIGDYFPFLFHGFSHKCPRLVQMWYEPTTGCHICNFSFMILDQIIYVRVSIFKGIMYNVH